MTQRNKLNRKVRPFLAPINLQTQSKSHEGSLSINLFRMRTATKILLASFSTPVFFEKDKC